MESLRAGTGLLMVRTYLSIWHRNSMFLVIQALPRFPLILLTQNSMTVIPDYAKMSYLVRAPTEDEVTELAKRVVACFE